MTVRDGEAWTEVLPPSTEAATVARRAVRNQLSQLSADDFSEAASLAVSELVTNAMVHAGAPVEIAVWARPDAVRVEVSDSSRHLPQARGYAVTAGTGRGLLLVEHTVDRWGAHLTPAGKTVWFEIGAPVWSTSEDVPESPTDAHGSPVRVTLRGFPLLMHWAWQEHAQALLREYLLYACESDPSVLDGHAAASDALNVLYEQVPPPELPAGPRDLLDRALEPEVTAQELSVQVPTASMASFATLERLLDQAISAAVEGQLLAPPTQPEIYEMREWLCNEILGQAEGRPPTAWRPRTDVRASLEGVAELTHRYGHLAQNSAAILVTNEASVIVAVSDAALRLLGYEEPDDLVGRRILVVVPTRYHQAHIAGTTLNATNGRDNLLGVPLTVPVVHASGHELLLQLRVDPRLLEDGDRVFIATLTPPAGRD